MTTRQDQLLRTSKASLPRPQRQVPLRHSPTPRVQDGPNDIARVIISLVAMASAAAVLLGAERQASATCMQRCELHLVDTRCTDLGIAHVPAGQTPRFSVLCLDYCSPPGGPVSRSVRPIDGTFASSVRVVRTGCSQPEPITWRMTSQTCGQARVIEADSPLEGGTYRLETTGAAATFKVDGTEPKGCPTDEARNRHLGVLAKEKQRRRQHDRQRALFKVDNSLLEKQRIDQQRREAEYRARLKRQWERDQRMCTPPSIWHAAQHRCEGIPIPASERPWKCRGFGSRWNEQRRKWSVFVSAGGGGTMLRRRHEDGSASENSWLAGGTFSVGLLHYEHVRRSSWSIEGFKWCASVAGCGGLGMLFMPPDSVLGNELGLDLRVGVGQEMQQGAPTTTSTSIGVRPVFRYSGRGRVRTGTLVGSLLPEWGYRHSQQSGWDTHLYWWLVPVDILASRHMAVSWDGLGIGMSIPLNGEKVAFAMTSNLSLQLQCSPW